MTRPEKVNRMKGSRNAHTGIRITNTRSKRRNLPLTPRQVVLILLMLFSFMGSGIGYVWSNFETTQIGYDLSHLKQEEMRLKEINRKLRLELATLKSPKRLEPLAVQRFDLVQPKAEQIIVLP